MATFKPVSARVERLKERYRTTYPILDSERASIVTEFYRENEDEMGIIKRAKTLFEVCSKMTIRVEEDELIVGNMAKNYRGATMFPEFGVTWFFDELRSGVFEKRNEVEEGFKLSEDDKDVFLSMESFWRTHSVGARMSKVMPEGYASVAGNGVTTFLGAGKDNSDGPTGHFNANYTKVCERGFGDIRQEALDKMAQMEGKVFGNDARKYTFYRSIVIVCDAAMVLSKRYGAMCRAQAQTATPQRQAELLKMADSLEWIMEHPCRTFSEAVQATYLYQLLLSLDGNMHGLTIGRFDQYTWPYLKADLEAGRTTLDEAQEVLDCMFLKISDTNKLKSVGGALNAGGYSSGQHMSLGGVTRSGEDATNPVSYLMLQVAARLHIHEPPLSVRVHDGTPAELWDLAIETTKRVGGIPTLQNDKVIIPSLLAKGFTLEDARDYCIIGCVEPAGSGNEFPACGGTGRETFWNMTNALVLAINNGVNPFSGKQVGLPTGYLYDFKTFEEVKEAYKKQIHYFVDWHVTLTNFYEMVVSEIMPIPIASATMDGCMENGADVVWGGSKYNSTGIAGIGCANVGDSLSALKYMIFDTQKTTAKEFYDALMANWEGYETLQQDVFNLVPRYGNDEESVDALTSWAMDVFSNRVNESTGPRGTYRAGLYPVSVHIAFGKGTFATPDGRRKGEPLSDGISPMQGMDKNGPSAVLNSVARINHVNNANGTLLNMKFHPKSVQGEEGTMKLRQLVETFFDNDGMHIQYNVVGADTLKAAQNEPEKYRDLVIRIAGFSAYFVELYKDLQDDLIRRSEQTM
jgi:formate C-acetyltransferase